MAADDDPFLESSCIMQYETRQGLTWKALRATSQPGKNDALRANLQQKPGPVGVNSLCFWQITVNDNREPPGQAGKGSMPQRVLIPSPF